MLRATRQCWGKGRVKLRREAEILHFALERYSTRPLSGRAQLREAEQRGFATFPVHHEPPQDMDRWWIVPDQHSLHDYPPGRPGSGETKCPLKTHHLLLPSCPPHVPQDVNPRGRRRSELGGGLWTQLHPLLPVEVPGARGQPTESLPHPDSPQPGPAL